MESLILKISDFYQIEKKGLVLVVDTEKVNQSFQVGNSCEIITTTGSIPTKITGIELVDQETEMESHTFVGVIVEGHVRQEDLTTASLLYIFPSF